MEVIDDVEIVVMMLLVLLVVADNVVVGVMACFSTTGGVSVLLLLILLSCSLISSSQNHSSFSAFVWSDILFPLNNIDSTFFWASTSSAISISFLLSVTRLTLFFFVLFILAPLNPFACKRKKVNQ